MIPRSRGAISGVLLIALGAWGALIPFVGPNFNFAYDPNIPWTWTSGRGWLEVLPGVVTVVGGLLLLTSRSRGAAMLGGWLGVIAGAWFVVGRLFAGPWQLGDFGAPVATTMAGMMLLELAFFTGLGAVIIFVGSLAIGRLSVRSQRDIRYSERVAVSDRYESVPVAEPVPSTVAEPVPATTAAHRARDVDEPDMPRKHWGWRGMFGGHGRRPIAH